MSISTLFWLAAFFVVLKSYYDLLIQLLNKPSPEVLIAGFYKGFVFKFLLCLIVFWGGVPSLGIKNSLIFIAGLVTMNSVFLIYHAY